MLALKRVVTVAVMIYLLLALLFILVPSVRTTVMGVGSGLSDLAQERQFFYVMFIIGAVVLALQLLTENLDSVLLRRAVSQHEGKINELKAKLYDNQQRTTAPVVSGSRTIDGRVPVAPAPERIVASSSTENRTADHLPQPTFPQNDPSLSNTPPADRPAL
ncbi:hypothetical protein [Hymenobacter terricola]|uniref:hypothetical protein n=1 Tax=Hymenobacter terricola TaxID=2819236 RepID=UPI001B30ADF3|nr:hypothetical protein [Hymenobacter terricola]